MPFDKSVMTCNPQPKPKWPQANLTSVITQLGKLPCLWGLRGRYFLTGIEGNRRAKNTHTKKLVGVLRTWDLHNTIAPGGYFIPLNSLPIEWTLVRTSRQTVWLPLKTPKGNKVRNGTREVNKRHWHNSLCFAVAFLLPRKIIGARPLPGNPYGQLLRASVPAEVKRISNLLQRLADVQFF